jgi:hypothetical protein
LTVSNGTLGTELSLTINRAASGFTHTITYKCGTASGTVGTGLGTSAKWNTSNGNTAALSSQNTNGTTVAVTFTLTTYSGSTAIGTSTKAVTMNIPSSVVPSISNIALSEASGVVPSGFGYVQNHSKLKIVTTSAGAYGSTIKAISVKYDGVTYSGGTVTTNVLGYSGARTITVKVTDTRGRTATSTVSVTVQAYSEPVINSFTVVRCNANGSLNEQGEYMRISYNVSITALGNKNGKSLVVRYKKSSEASYTERQVTMSAYSLSGALDPIPADSGSSYNVGLVVTDAFAAVTKNLVLQSAFTILNFKADGTGVGAGKVSEDPNLWDFGFNVRFGGGITAPVLEAGTNFDDVKTPNIYNLLNTASANYINCPIASGTASLEVVECGNSYQKHQILRVCSKTNPLVYERFYYENSWGEWVNTSAFGGSLLWSGALYMLDTHTITLPKKISEQPNGIVLVFSEYEDGEAKNYMFQHKFIPKYTVAAHSGSGHSIMLCNSTLNRIAVKYLYIADDNIKGHVNNDGTGTASSGITYINNRFVLRYVIGV